MLLKWIACGYGMVWCLSVIVIMASIQHGPRDAKDETLLKWAVLVGLSPFIAAKKAYQFARFVIRDVRGVQQRREWEA